MRVSVDKKTMLGETIRIKKSGSKAAVGMGNIVAAVVARLDVVVGRAREGKWWWKLKRTKPRVVAEALIGKLLVPGP